MKTKTCLAFLVFLSLALQISFSQAWCEALQVKVWSLNGYGVPNASVQINYHKGDSQARDGFVSGYTDEEGVFKAGICNHIPGNYTDRDYIGIRVDYPEFSETRTTIQGVNRVGTIHEENFFIGKNAWPVKIFIKDQKSDPLQGVQVTVTHPISRILVTDSDGKVVFNAVEGSVSFSAAYKGENTTKTFGSTENAVYNLTFLNYDFTLVAEFFSEETNTPISGVETNLSYENFSESRSSDLNGRVVYKNIASQNVTIETKYNGITRSFVIPLVNETTKMSINLSKNPVTIGEVLFDKSVGAECQNFSVSARVTQANGEPGEVKTTLEYRAGSASGSQAMQYNQETEMFETSVPCGGLSLPNNVTIMVKADSNYSHAAKGPLNYTIDAPAQQGVTPPPIQQPIQQQPVDLLGGSGPSPLMLLGGAILLIIGFLTIISIIMSSMKKSKEGKETAGVKPLELSVPKPEIKSEAELASPVIEKPAGWWEKEIPKTIEDKPADEKPVIKKKTLDHAPELTSAVETLKKWRLEKEEREKAESIGENKPRSASKTQTKPKPGKK